MATTQNPWLKYVNKGAIRDKDINKELIDAMSFLNNMGIRMEVFSGGQSAKGSGGKRTGSTRHDHGGAADAKFYAADGHQLKESNPQDQAILGSIAAQARANGVTGIGAGKGYMGDGSMHLGFGKEGTWGKGGKGANTPKWLRDSYALGASGDVPTSQPSVLGYAPNATSQFAPQSAPKPIAKPKPWQQTLTSIGKKTKEGRPIYKNQEGESVSEYSTTENVPELGGWINLPTVYDGGFVSPDEAVQRAIDTQGHDSVTGRKLNVFNNMSEAVNAAKNRSKSLSQGNNRPLEQVNMANANMGLPDNSGGISSFGANPFQQSRGVNMFSPQQMQQPAQQLQARGGMGGIPLEKMGMISGARQPSQQPAPQVQQARRLPEVRPTMRPPKPKANPRGYQGATPTKDAKGKWHFSSFMDMINYNNPQTMNKPKPKSGTGEEHRFDLFDLFK